MGLFLVVIWPTIWSHPLSGLSSIANYYLNTGLNSDKLQPEGFILLFGFNIYPLLLVLTQTPEVVLVLVGLGVLRVFRKNKDQLKTGYLLLLWLFVPIFRFSLPGTYFYSGFRQLIEVVPAMAILAGIGVEYLMQKTKNSMIVIIFIIIIMIILFIPIIKLHPNENVYFNNLAGGIKGAGKKNLIDWTLTYGNIYKQGAKWLNENTQKEANLAILNGSMFAISPLFLRNDISISPYHFSGLEQKGEYIMDLYNPFNPAVFAHRYLRQFLIPIHTISQDNIPLLSIYKNDQDFVKPEFQKEQTTNQFLINPVRLSSGKYFYIEIDLKKVVKVTRIVLTDVSDKCLLSKTLMPDELVSFLPGKEVFGANEKHHTGEAQVEFVFAAEPARIIRIYPKSEYSCFLDSKITAISFVP